MKDVIKAIPGVLFIIIITILIALLIYDEYENQNNTKKINTIIEERAIDHERHIEKSKELVERIDDFLESTDFRKRL